MHADARQQARPDSDVPVSPGVAKVSCFQALPFHDSASGPPVATQEWAARQATPDSADWPPGAGVGVLRQALPFHAMPELKSEPLSLPAPPTATHADALSQATPAMPQNGVQPLPGVFSERHARPFHASATFASPLESVPTAMQNVLRVQATPARTSPAVP